MNYIGIDGNVYSDSLIHWKYIKKIKSGSGWRYFYTPEEIRAYYKEEQGKANAEYKRDIKDANKTYNVNKHYNNLMRKNAKRNAEDIIYLRTDQKGKTRVLEGKERRQAVNDEVKKTKKRADKWDKLNERTLSRSKKKEEFERKVDPVLNTAKAVASKPINEATKPAKQNIKDVKDYYKWQEQKANKRYKKEQKEIKEITKGAREWNRVYSQEGGYGDNSRAKGRAISIGITAGSKGAKTISSIRKSATPKINTGKAIVNRTLKKELNAERKRREAARKRKTAKTINKKVRDVSKTATEALVFGVKKNETRKNRSGNKSYKTYNRW